VISTRAHRSRKISRRVHRCEANSSTSHASRARASRRVMRDSSIAIDCDVSTRDQLTSRRRDRYGGFQDFVFEKEKLYPLASTQVHGRRRAARVFQLAILHKVGCSWFARPMPLLVVGSAGPTTPPRFEPTTRRGIGRQTGEPTVSHEGGSGSELFLLDLFVTKGTFPSPLRRCSRRIHPTARRAARDVDHHGASARVEQRTPTPSASFGGAS
jgi:hypothetical protein